MKRLLLSFVLLALAAPASAQEATAPVGIVQDTATVETGPSPRGAFVRSLLVPGWGQLYAGSPVRAGVFIALQGTSYAMLAKSINRLEDIRRTEGARLSVVRDSILIVAQTDTVLAREIQDEVRFDELVGRDVELTGMRELVRARTRHRQDWITYTIVFTMASAIDAYVGAHLASFPAGISASPRPDGGMSVQLSVPTGRRQ